ncbi:semaphorin-3F isoform X2, partial [Clarias magur]
MLSDRFRLVRILLVLSVLLVPSSANDALSAPRVFLSFKEIKRRKFRFGNTMEDVMPVR